MSAPKVLSANNSTEHGQVWTVLSSLPCIFGCKREHSAPELHMTVTANRGGGPGETIAHDNQSKTVRLLVTIAHSLHAAEGSKTTCIFMSTCLGHVEPANARRVGGIKAQDSHPAVSSNPNATGTHTRQRGELGGIVTRLEEFFIHAKTNTAGSAPIAHPTPLHTLCTRFALRVHGATGKINDRLFEEIKTKRRPLSIQKGSNNDIIRM